MISGEEAKAARKLIGWSQKKLAVEANISAMTVAKFEIGKPITGRKIRAIHETLEMAGVDRRRRQ
jgi:transcriptional regulator with XRE-family HTH domain